MIRVLLFGALGRMGREIATLSNRYNNIKIVKLVDKNTIGGIADYSVMTGIKGYDFELIDDSSEHLFEEVDCVVEFSEHKATAKHVKIAEEYGVSYVIGTTGFNEEELGVISEASKSIPIFISSNMSRGINMINALLKQIVNNFIGYDIEIWEMHHREKRDAPSGTAMMLARTVKEISTDDLTIVLGRSGTDSKRQKNEISISSIRGGDIFGEHHIMFAGDGENIEIVHRATNRKIFAKGALDAVGFIVNKRKGLYTYKDMLKI